MYKQAFKPKIDADGKLTKRPHLKKTAVLSQTIDRVDLENPFALSLGGRDHVVVR